MISNSNDFGSNSESMNKQVKLEVKKSENHTKIFDNIQGIGCCNITNNLKNFQSINKSIKTKNKANDNHFKDTKSNMQVYNSHEYPYLQDNFNCKNKELSSSQFIIGNLQIEIKPFDKSIITKTENKNINGNGKEDRNALYNNSLEDLNYYNWTMVEKNHINLFNDFFDLTAQSFKVANYIVNYAVFKDFIWKLGISGFKEGKDEIKNLWIILGGYKFQRILLKDLKSFLKLMLNNLIKSKPSIGCIKSSNESLNLQKCNQGDHRLTCLNYTKAKRLFNTKSKKDLAQTKTSEKVQNKKNISDLDFSKIYFEQGGIRFNKYLKEFVKNHFVIIYHHKEYPIKASKTIHNPIKKNYKTTDSNKKINRNRSEKIIQLYGMKEPPHTTNRKMSLEIKSKILIQTESPRENESESQSECQIEWPASLPSHKNYKIKISEYNKAQEIPKIIQSSERKLEKISQLILNTEKNNDFVNGQNFKNESKVKNFIDSSRKFKTNKIFKDYFMSNLNKSETALKSQGKISRNKMIVTQSMDLKDFLKRKNTINFNLSQNRSPKLNVKHLKKISQSVKTKIKPFINLESSPFKKSKISSWNFNKNCNEKEHNWLSKKMNFKYIGQERINQTHPIFLQEENNSGKEFIMDKTHKPYKGFSLLNVNKDEMVQNQEEFLNNMGLIENNKTKNFKVNSYRKNEKIEKNCLKESELKKLEFEFKVNNPLKFRKNNELMDTSNNSKESSLSSSLIALDDDTKKEFVNSESQSFNDSSLSQNKLFDMEHTESGLNKCNCKNYKIIKDKVLEDIKLSAIEEEMN